MSSPEKKKEKNQTQLNLYILLYQTPKAREESEKPQ